MNVSVELKEKAYDIVKNSKNPWVMTTDIIENLEAEGFIVEDAIGEDESSILFTKDRKIRVIYIRNDLNSSIKAKNLLFFYGYYKLTNTEGYGFIRKSFSDIKGSLKRQAKELGMLLRNYSVEKQFDNELFQDKDSLLQKKR